jgi:hypothetical protein
VDSQLQVLRKLLIEFLVIFSILYNLLDHLKALLCDILLNHLQDFIMLQELSRNIERQILAVNYPLDEAQILGDKLLAIVHNKDPPDIKLNVVLLLLSLEKIKRRSLGEEKDGFELQASFDGELLDMKVLLPVIGELLIKISVLLLFDIFRLPHPERFVLVDLLKLGRDLLDLFLLFLLFFLLDFSFVLFFLLIIFIVRNLLLGCLLDLEFDCESNELRVFLDEILEPLLLEEFEVVALQMTDDHGSSCQLNGVIRIVDNRECATCC